MMSTTHDRATSAQVPHLWSELPPAQFDLLLPWWLKAAAIALLTIVAILWLDRPIAHWALTTHPIPDLLDPKARHGDAGREFMFLEQFGQGVCSVLVILAVFLLDKDGKRKALALAIGCALTVLVIYILKNSFGRTRPYTFIEGLPVGSWIWGGPSKGFANGSAWGSFPSAHTSGAFALSAGLSWFYPRGRALFMALATFTAFQRVLHGAHFLSDVLLAMGLSVLLMRWSLGLGLAGRLLKQPPITPPPVQPLPYSPSSPR